MVGDALHRFCPGRAVPDVCGLGSCAQRVDTHGRPEPAGICLGPRDRAECIDMTAAEHSRGQPRDEWTADMPYAADADNGSGIDSSAAVTSVAARDKQTVARGVGVLVVKRGPYADRSSDWTAPS